MFRKKEGDKVMNEGSAEEVVTEESVAMEDNTVDGPPEILVESMPEGEIVGLAIESVPMVEEQTSVSGDESAILPPIIESVESEEPVEQPVSVEPVDPFVEPPSELPHLETQPIAPYIPITPNSETWSVTSDEIVKEEIINK